MELKADALLRSCAHGFLVDEGAWKKTHTHRGWSKRFTGSYWISVETFAYVSFSYLFFLKKIEEE